jgi:hypothetical protein
MRQLVPYSLWLGHVGDARNLRALLAAGIAAVVDLALNEPPAAITRELAYCRCPLVDGAGNAPWLLRLAVETTASLLRARTPTLVYCSGGMSRSPAIAAAALAVVTGRPLANCLAEVVAAGAHDVSPGLWRDVSREVAELLAEPGDQPAP